MRFTVQIVVCYDTGFWCEYTIEVFEHPGAFRKSIVKRAMEQIKSDNITYKFVVSVKRHDVYGEIEVKQRPGGVMIDKKDIEKFFFSLMNEPKYGWVNKPTVDTFWRKNGPLVISVQKMYESPIVVNFALLKKISEKFKTDKVDVDDWGRGGCESCDYGSSYGHTFQIYEPGVQVLLEEND